MYVIYTWYNGIFIIIIYMCVNYVITPSHVLKWVLPFSSSQTTPWWLHGILIRLQLGLATTWFWTKNTEEEDSIAAAQRFAWLNIKWNMANQSTRLPWMYQSNNKRCSYTYKYFHFLSIIRLYSKWRRQFLFWRLSHSIGPFPWHLASPEQIFLAENGLSFKTLS